MRKVKRKPKSTLLYRQLKLLGACERRACRYKGLTVESGWRKATVGDLRWVLRTAAYYIHWHLAADDYNRRRFKDWLTGKLDRTFSIVHTGEFKRAFRKSTVVKILAMATGIKR